MNEKLQGGLAKFLLRPPRPSAVLSSLAGSAPDGIGNYSPNAPRHSPPSLPPSDLPPASLPIRSLIYLQFRAVMRCRCENRGQPVGGMPLLSRVGTRCLGAGARGGGNYPARDAGIKSVGSGECGSTRVSAGRAHRPEDRPVSLSLSLSLSFLFFPFFLSRRACIRRPSPVSLFTR